MANEFIIKNGFHSKGDSEITGSLEVSGSNTNFILNSTDSKFTDSRATTKGIEYSADYSSNFTSRSLVDRNYVDTNITTNITASVGSGLTYNTSSGKIVLGGILSGSGNPSNRTFFLPKGEGVHDIRWGMDSSGNLGEDDFGNPTYIDRFSWISRNGEHHLIGGSGDPPGVTTLGCYYSQGTGNPGFVKQYKDVRQVNMNFNPSTTTGSLTYRYADSQVGATEEIYQSENSVARSSLIRLYDKHEYRITGSSSTSEMLLNASFLNTRIKDTSTNENTYSSITKYGWMASHQSGSGMGMFILRADNINLTDSDSCGVATFPNKQTKVGNIIGGNLTISSGSQDSTYTDGTTAKKGIKYVGFGETNADTAAGANYNTLVGTSLVPKKYLEDYVAASASADTIYTANSTLSGNRVVDQSTYTLSFNGNNAGSITTNFNGRTAFISNRTAGEANILEIQDNSNNRIFEVRQNNSVHINAQGTGDVVLGGNAQIGTEDISLQGNTLITKKLELSTTTDGMLMPRLTTAQMNAISTPDTHLLIFNTTLNALYRYNGSAWVAMAAGYGVIEVKDSSGNPTFYTDLPTAFTAAGSGGVITLHSNITVTSQCTMPGSANAAFTINGNGYTITHTSNTGSEFNFIDIGSSTNKIYLNDISVISNGTGTSSNSSVFINSGEVINNNTTSIQSNVNNIAQSCSVTGGKLICSNAIANFTGKLTNLTLEAYQTRGSLIGCDITLINNGSILDGNLIELMNCNITGNSTSGTMVNLSSFTKCYNNRILCTTGSNNAVIIDSGSLNGFPCFEKCSLIQQGTGQAITYSGARPIVNSYIYSSSSVCVRGTGVTNTQSSYNLENVICENNASSKPVLEMTSGFGVSVRNSTFTSLNSSNTKATIELLLVSSFKARIIDCRVNNSNNSVNNIKFDGSPSTGGAFIYGLTMSEKGTGIAYNSVSLLNINTVDSYGNVKIG